MKIEDKYKKLSQREHVLHRPGMYIGSVKKQIEELWVPKDENGSFKMEKTMVEYSPGFMKIFDEVLTNATDHSFRDSTVTTIKVEYCKESGELSVWNNGSGIPIQLHKEHNIYVPELIFGYLLSGSNYNDNNTRTGAGTNGLGSKCHLHSTKIPLFNGEIKKASEINVGDILIGDDGTPRTVLNKTEGFGEMYEIIQNYGENYIVNNNHTLTLHMPDHKVIFWNTNGWSSIWWNNDKKCIETKFIKVFNNTIKCPECNIELNSRLSRHYKRKHKNTKLPKFTRKSPTYGDLKNQIVKEKYEEMKKFLEEIPYNSIFDINIQDYLKLNKTIQRRLAGVRGECVQWPDKEVELDPYILGLWLGDGMKDGRQYACFGEKDPEIINYFEDWCEENDAIIEQKLYNKYTYGLHSKSKFGKKNSLPLRNILKKYNLINNKHIPKEYLINSRDIRIKLLAGIIDTDGTVIRDGTRIIITQSHIHKRLIDDIVYLVRSLGFFCCVNSYMAKYKLENGEEKESLAYKVNISGNIDDIPTLLPRKKCKKTKRQNTDKSTGYIKINKVKNNKYVGFETDGNQRFVINDFTVTHNCTNIFSKKFIIETIDSEEKKKFIQEYSENMTQKTKAKITKNSGKSYTKITFIPDYERFGMKGLEDDTILLICKRVLDCIAFTNNIQIYLNGEKIKGKGLVDYTKYFFENEKVITESHIEKYKNKNGEVIEYIWEYAIVPYSQYEQVSFVNGNSTIQGGKHVDYIMYQIINKYKKMLEEKKKLKELKPNFIKDKMFLFLRATVSNPSFNSQTKEQLTTPSKDFGCNIVVSDQFINKLYKSQITDDIVEFCKIKESVDLSKSTNGKKVNKLYIPKLEDAHFAGTTKSSKCTLILTEGDSAKTFAMWGRTVIGSDYFGVFSLKGKIINIRDASSSQLLNNEELNNIKKIIGLQHGKKYTSVEELRYGKVMLLMDADHDGSHIKNLFINFIHYYWPELLKIDFIQSLRTPIVKIFSKNKNLEFYTEQEYNKWKNNNDIKNLKIKYYKGLGTSQKDDAKQIFSRINELMINYYYKNKQCEESILLAFSKDKDISANKRKEWLKEYDKDVYLDLKQKNISYSDLINKELIHFSNYDNIRSIPQLMDGLKPSQRKILYYMLSNNITKSIKVAQLSGYVSAETSYHHGEASLQQAIITMSQDFIGTNNINLLYPDGNHGCLSPYTKVVTIKGVKYAKDICKGDLLQGDDMKIRKVLETTKGKDLMYKIYYDKNKYYIVNSQHILTLSYKINKKYKNNKIDLTIFDSETLKEKIIKTQKINVKDIINKYKKVDIKVEDYLKLPIYLKVKFTNTYYDNILEWKTNNKITIPPYIYGNWYLSHINSYVLKITNIESYNEWKTYCKNNSINMLQYSKTCKYKLCSKWINKIKTKEKQYNNIIPPEYIYTSLSDRLEFIIGLTDSPKIVRRNGWYKLELYDKKKFTSIISLLKTFVNTYLQFKTKLEKNKFNFYKYYIYINITKRKNLTNKICKIEEIGIDEYVGFEIDGNKRFIIETSNKDYIVTHNSRLLGGKDAASPRYIYTYLNGITKNIFDKNDDNLLEYKEDDGLKVEPEFYVPIIPMILVNGCEGIGTGYSTFIPQCNPKDIIENIKLKIKNKKLKELKPWYKNFKGDIIKKEDNKYIINGKWERKNKTIVITELPIGVWITQYKEYIEKKIKDENASVITDIKNMSLDENTNIKIVITFKSDDILDKLIENNELETLLKLTKTQSHNNMYLFNNKSLKKYNSLNEILLDFYDKRLEFYKLRKQNCINILKNELIILEQKSKFIADFINEKIIIIKKEINEIDKQLENNNYIKVDNTYDYLTNMSLRSLTKNKIDELNKSINNKRYELDKLNNSTEYDLWLEDLDKLEKLI